MRMRLNKVVVCFSVLIAALGVSATSASAHSSCGSHTDWHTIKFHNDQHTLKNAVVLDIHNVAVQNKNTTHGYWYDWAVCSK